MKHWVRFGPLELHHPLLLCGMLYLLLYFDASGFLRLGLASALLHEAGHILVYWVFTGRCPVIQIGLTGLCMRHRGAGFLRKKCSGWRLLDRGSICCWLWVGTFGLFIGPRCGAVPFWRPIC